MYFLLSLFIILFLRFLYVHVPFMVLPVITQNWPSFPEGNIIQLPPCAGQVEDTPAAGGPPKSATAVATGRRVLGRVRAAAGRHRWPEAIQGQRHPHPPNGGCSRKLQAARGGPRRPDRPELAGAGPGRHRLAGGFAGRIRAGAARVGQSLPGPGPKAGWGQPLASHGQQPRASCGCSHKCSRRS